MYWQCFTSIFVTINPFLPHSCAWFSDLTRELRREIFVTKNWIISKVAFLFPIQVAKEWLTGLSIFVDFTFLTVCTSLFFFERVMFRFFLFERKKKRVIIPGLSSSSEIWRHMKSSSSLRRTSFLRKNFTRDITQLLIIQLDKILNSVIQAESQKLIDPEKMKKYLSELNEEAYVRSVKIDVLK